MRTSTAIAALLVWMLWAPGVQGQKAKGAEVPKRPALGVAADTNDASLYRRLGATKLSVDPKQAANAFYWAYRLDPSLAEPLYARRIALMISFPTMMVDYLNGKKHAIQSRDMRSADSLYYRALRRDPLLYRRFDSELMRKYVQTVAAKLGQQYNLSPSALEHEMQTYLARATPYHQALFAYGDGRFADAVRHYTSELKRTKDKAGVYADRGRSYALLGDLGRAQEDFAQALVELRDQDEKKLVFFYDSKAVFEHSIGAIYEQAGNIPAAREAYARALQEDISYAPSHWRLGTMALLQQDTAGALAAFDLATQIDPEDAVFRLAYGSVLHATGEHSLAIEHLAKAIEVEPYFADPYAVLGAALEAAGQAPEALARYEEFLTRARRAHPGRRGVQTRVDALRAAAGNPGGGVGQ